MFIPVAFFGMRETYAPVLLERKAARLRKHTGNGALQSSLGGGVNHKRTFQNAIIRPLKLLAVVPIITLMSIYVAIEYGIMYLLMSTFSIVYEGQYGFDAGTSGLSYLPLGIGMLIGVVTFGRVSDKLVLQNKSKGGEHRPEIRLAPLFSIPCGLAIVAGLFIYGWTTDKKTHWIASMIGVALFGAGLMAIMVSFFSRTFNDSTDGDRCVFKIIYWMRIHRLQHLLLHHLLCCGQLQAHYCLCVHLMFMKVWVWDGAIVCLHLYLWLWYRSRWPSISLESVFVECPVI